METSTLRLYFAIGSVLYSLVMFQAAKGSAILMAYVFGGLPWLWSVCCCCCIRCCACCRRPKERAGCMSFPYDKDLDGGNCRLCYGCWFGLWRRFFEYN